MKRSNIVAAFIIAAGFIFLIACSPSTHIEKDKYADFSRYKTYSWMDSEQEKGNVNSLAEQNIKIAVKEELKKEGWQEVRNNPDVLIGYDVLVEKTSKERNNPVYSQPYSRLYYNPYSRRYGTLFYPSQFLGYDKESFLTKEGTITVTMIDVMTDKMVWQGWTTNEVNSNNLTHREIQNGIRSIFRKFDVAKN